ncbi:MAG TPA: FtsX-like permease family protein [Tepidisphaeraceae bacterium]|nr:FtsX-like permease family protein [Tepidisphaeraceae bacterium]
MRLFFPRLTWGHFRRHRLEGLLCLMGVALGVAVIVAIESAVNASVGSFSGAVDSLAERSTHSIFSTSGEIPDQQFIDLLMKKLPYPLAPVIDRNVLVDGRLGRLIGIDLFSERGLRTLTDTQATFDADARREFLTQPDTVVLVDALAQRLKAHIGSTVTLTINSWRTPVRVVGIVQPTGLARAQLTDVIVADLATAQELTDSIGKIDRIDTRLEDDQQVNDLSSALPKDLYLRSTQQQADSLNQLTASYRLNLLALSMMASFVAVFIVYNSMLVSVRQRVVSLGIMRCLGASRGQLARLYLMEALLFALLGAGIGLAMGWAIAREMVGYVSTTINELYAPVRPGPVTLSWPLVYRGLAVSLGSCLVGAIVPLWEAWRVPPINAFRETAGRDVSRIKARRLLVAGVLFLAIGWAIDFIPSRSPVLGFVMAIFVAFGFALTCPWATRRVGAALAAVARPMQTLPLSMAASNVQRSLGTTGVAVAAMMLAMAMNVSVRTMVGSFREALRNWTDRRFAADLVVAPDLQINHKIAAELSPAIFRWVSHQPQVVTAIPNRTITIQVGGEPTQLMATDLSDLLQHVQIKSIATGQDPDWQQDILISEPLSVRMDLRVGDTLALASPTGLLNFRVFGIVYDFGSEHGQILMNYSTYGGDWDDPNMTSLHVKLLPGVDPDALAARWTAMWAPKSPVIATSVRNIKAQILRIFDQTFAVTNVLSYLAGLVAFCGLAGSLMALALARRRDYSILAAIGMSARQTAAWILGQGLLIAWTAAIVASIAGTLLAYVLAYVIQYRSFGWSIPAYPEPRYWAQNFLLATVAALIATIYPVLKLRSVPPAGGLRGE